MNTTNQHKKNVTIPKVELGKTGLKVSRLAFGTGSDGWLGRSKQSDLGVERLAVLLRSAYEYGINFWDTADAYGTHPHIAKALETIPREKVVILTKTLSQNRNKVQEDIERFLKELNTDHIDIILLHVMTHADWPRRLADTMEVLSRAKQAGKVRALGVSCHSFKALKATLRTDWCEVIMARINHAGVNMDDTPKRVAPVLQQIHAAGKAIVGMKVLGNGRLSNDVGSAVEYVLKLGSVHAITAGISDPNQLIENAQWVSKLTPIYPPEN